MTAQECYDGMVTYFSKDGAQLAKDGSACLYRLDVGKDVPPLKCAVGCLIPDEKYTTDMDDVYGSISEWCDNYSAEADAAFVDIFGKDDETHDFLIRAQGIHDNAVEVSDFLDGLKDMADRFGLTVAS